MESQGFDPCTSDTDVMPPLYQYCISPYAVHMTMLGGPQSPFFPTTRVQETADAAKLVQDAARLTPWALTDSFISSIREGKGQMAISGFGDPTGRGRGFSYVRQPTRRVRLTLSKEVETQAARCCCLGDCCDVVP